METSNTVLTGIPYLDYDDHQRGRNAIIKYHNKMCELYPSYNISLDNLVKGLRERQGQKFFLDQLGLQIINGDISEKTVTDAMNYLAVSGKGKIPATNNAFTTVLTNQVQAEVNYTDLGSFVVIQTAWDIYNESEKQAAAVLNFAGIAADKTGNILGATADSVTSILTSAKYVIPIVVIGGALLYVYLMPKRG